MAEVKINKSVTIHVSADEAPLLLKLIQTGMASDDILVSDPAYALGSDIEDALLAENFDDSDYAEGA